MNKKAAIILLSASLAFLVASVLLINTQLKTQKILGDSEIELSGLQKSEILHLMYLETAAKFALAETIKAAPLGQQDFYTICLAKNKACEEIPQYFKAAFKKHVDSFNKAYDQNLDLKNYEFKSRLINIDNKPGIELIGVSTDKMTIKKKEDVSYITSPNFRIQVSLDELNELSTTPETIAIDFFDNLVDKFQRCLERNKDRKISCFCDNSEINPDELPEGYKISIITTATKEKLFGGVDYQFKLLDKENKIVMRERRQEVRALRGIFGAYELFDTDTKGSLCYPGAFSLSQGYVFDKNMEKGKLYFFIGDANCKGVSQFSMAEFVKESDLGKPKGPSCSEIGVKAP